MSARYKEIERERVKELERIKEMQPQFNTTKPLEKYFHKAIEIIFSGQMNNATLNGLGIHPNIKKISNFYVSISKHPEEVEKCKNAFLHLYKNKTFKLLEDEKLIEFLHNAMSMSLFWVREFNSWQKTTHNIHKQLSSILRHMFAKYPVPLFLDEAWQGYENYNTLKTNAHIDWFIHIGSGKSARELIKFPVTMTKKLAHEFINTPEGYTIDEAIRRAQVISMGGSNWLAWYICRSRLGQGHYDNGMFWSTVILFFCKAPMFDYEHIPEIIDYITAQKFNSHRVQVADGTFQRVIANPNFSMKGRTLEALIRETEAWHNRIANETKHAKTASSWESTRLKEFYLTEGSIQKGTERTYSIIELLKSSELATEGRRMHNCVYSYAGSCKSGRCSIWSLRVDSQHNATEESLATIEVANQSKTIVQIRAKNNSKSGQKEKILIEKWANQAGLKVSNGAFGGW
ncbi:MAG: PcfJ domain-containing protein [bacterium]|nr:PcfJ domain-containing protein [bacterium]